MHDHCSKKKEGCHCWWTSISLSILLYDENNLCAAISETTRAFCIITFCSILDTSQQVYIILSSRLFLSGVTCCQCFALILLVTHAGRSRRTITIVVAMNHHCFLFWLDCWCSSTWYYLCLSPFFPLLICMVFIGQYWLSIVVEWVRTYGHVQTYLFCWMFAFFMLLMTALLRNQQIASVAKKSHDIPLPYFFEQRKACD